MGLFDLLQKNPQLCMNALLFYLLHKVKLLQAIFTKLIRNTLYKRFLLNLMENYFEISLFLEYRNRSTYVDFCIPKIWHS